MHRAWAHLQAALKGGGAIEAQVGMLRRHLARYARPLPQHATPLLFILTDFYSVVTAWKEAADVADFWAAAAPGAPASQLSSTMQAYKLDCVEGRSAC